VSLPQPDGGWNRRDRGDALEVALGVSTVRVTAIGWRFLASVSCALVLLAGCANGEPHSARDVAEDLGCTKIESMEVPAEWPEYEQAASCSLEGAKFAVYWTPGNQGLNVAGECLSDYRPSCERAMKDFNDYVAEAVTRTVP